ncbi:hypothetical protein BDW59DRAFT_138414 [Aspergillus cavernicola]|uniref:3'-5' exonuclease domain-containing protein n=1 Tax=Aspergillus cavernicola TaxID=176166 RepID=A0ABR4IZU7_9EURO
METSVATRDQNMDKEPVFINTQEGMSDLVDWIAGQETWLGNLQPPLYIDIEGERLSRHGKVSLLTVLVHLGKHHEHAHVIDIHTLGTVAFSTVGSRGKSFKDILESTQILKVFFDVRNDSDALYAHYGIKLQGIYDVQLMESARRPDTGRRKFVCGLSKCTEDIPNKKEREQWRLCKGEGRNVMEPCKGRLIQRVQHTASLR